MPVGSHHVVNPFGGPGHGRAGEKAAHCPRQGTASRAEQRGYCGRPLRAFAVGADPLDRKLALLGGKPEAGQVTLLPRDAPVGPFNHSAQQPHAAFAQRAGTIVNEEPSLVLPQLGLGGALYSHHITLLGVAGKLVGAACQ